MDADLAAGCRYRPRMDTDEHRFLGLHWPPMDADGRRFGSCCGLSLWATEGLRLRPFCWGSLAAQGRRWTPIWLSLRLVLRRWCWTEWLPMWIRRFSRRWALMV